jgi:hypothetical protein
MEMRSYEELAYIVLVVGPLSSLSIIFTINFLKSSLYKYCTVHKSRQNTCGDNRDRHYTVRVIKIPHSNDVKVKHT